PPQAQVPPIARALVRGHLESLDFHARLLARSGPVFPAQVRHHRDQRTGDGEARLDGIRDRKDVELELAAEEVEPLRDPGDLASAEVDVVPPGQEAEDAPPGAVLEHLARGTLVG